MMTLNDKKEGKTRMSLVPWLAIRKVAEVMTYGAKKHGVKNWLEGGDWSYIVDALFRHLLAWIEGESDDQETRKSHLAHAACNVLMLAELEARQIGNNDVQEGNKPLRKKIGHTEYERDVLEKALQRAWRLIEDIDGFVEKLEMNDKHHEEWNDEIAPKVDKILGLVDRRECNNWSDDVLESKIKIDES